MSLAQTTNKEQEEIIEQIHKQHKALKNREIQNLFLTLRAEILALDSQMQEISNKIYIAYKLRKNLVEVTPMQACLKFWLSLTYKEISNPRDIVRDVSNIGHHGTGNLEVVCKSLEDIPYCMELIKQAYKKQL